MNHMTNTSSSVNVGDTKDRFLNINTEQGEGRRGGGVSVDFPYSPRNLETHLDTCTSTGCQFIRLRFKKESAKSPEISTFLWFFWEVTSKR